MMNSEQLKSRSKNFGLRIVKLIDALPKTIAGHTVASQLIRSATSVGANYRAACRARSKNEFIAKIRIVVEEIDECCYWLEIIIESKMLKESLVAELYNEANELTAIFVASSKTATSQSSIINLKSSIKK